MDPRSLVDKLDALPTLEAQQALLCGQVPLLDAAAQLRLAHGLKERADHYLRSDIQRSLTTANLLIYLAEISGRPEHRALGLLAAGNGYSIGLGDFDRAIEQYREATAIYEAQDRSLEQASAQIGHVSALAHLGRYDEALAIGQWATKSLETQEAWLPLAKLNNNLAKVYFRQGEDAAALELFERAQELYERAGQHESGGWLRAEFNRAIVLRNLGQFDASIHSSQVAYALLTRLDEPVEAARAQQNLAITYFVLGRYNEALALLDQVRDVFLNDGRYRDAILAELFVSDCLLQLRRFADVLEKSQRIRASFTELGTRLEVAQAILNEGVAYAGTGDRQAALGSLSEAADLFTAEGSTTWVATAELERATVLLMQERFEESQVTATACISVFAEHGLAVSEARALLVAGRAATALGKHDQAERLARRVVAFAGRQDVPGLNHQARLLLGRLAEARGEIEPALVEYDRAIEALERLRGRLMVEFRTDFLEDKQSVYEDVVSLSLEMGRPDQGLEYVERAKSRALLDLLAFRLRLGIEARDAGDYPLVESLMSLRAERDRMYRRWESGEGFSQRGQLGEAEQNQAQEGVLLLEKKITDLWHKLLVRNADYARDAALWQVRAEPIQPYLEPDTLLLEYFFARDQLIAFLVTGDRVLARRLPSPATELESLLGRFRLNLKAVARLENTSRAALTRNAQGLLGKLYDLLLRPVADEISGFRRLIVVPHGPLHYLPFHAFHDGDAYLLERHEVSYLPGASFLHYVRQRPGNGMGLLAVGHSSQGQLPYAVAEADQIADLWPGERLLEAAATRDHLQAAAGACAIVHLATHADFRPDNPLFSGLALADGWLTTLDVFDLRLDASLVTLSACQTGRNVIGGGDELLGLMRAFLSAGVASLVLSQWAVEDRSTAALMEAFYLGLAEGRGKAAALREAQRLFLDETDGEDYGHPYFWAPFFLVGDPGRLPTIQAEDKRAAADRR